MNKDSNIKEEKEIINNMEYNVALGKISIKSNSIKASMKHRYLINKLERICSRNRFNNRNVS